MLLSKKLGEALLLLSLVALCTAARSRILNSLVNNADDTLRDSSPERDGSDTLLLPDIAKSSTRGSPKSSGQRTIYSHYHIPYHTVYPYSTPNPYSYGLYAMTTPYPYHPMAGYHPYSAMNYLHGYHPTAASYYNPAMNSLYGYHPTAASYYNPAMNSLYGYHPTAASYYNPAMNSLYGYHPMAASYYNPAMNSLYGYHPMAASYYNPAMNSLYGYHPTAASYYNPAMNSLYGYHPTAASYYNPAMNSLYGYHPTAASYYNPAMNSLHGYHPVAASYYNPAMNSLYGYHPTAASYYNPAMNSLYGYHPMAASYYNPAMNSLYGYHPVAASYYNPAMNSLYGYHPMAASYYNPAMNSLYGYHPVAASYYNPAMNSLYGYHPTAASYYNPAMNSLYGYHPMVAPYPFPAMNPVYVPVNGSSPKPPLTAYTFHAPMAPYSYLQPPMGYSPLYPPVGGSYYPMNSFYPYSAAVMPFNSFHPPMHPLSYLHPPMGYPFVYPAMNTMNPHNLMNPMYNPAHPMHPMNFYNPMNPINGMNFPYPFHPPMRVASYFLTPPLGTSYLLPSNGYGHFHPVPMQAASKLLQPSLVTAAPLSLHTHFPYSHQAGVYSPYFLPPYHPAAALQTVYPPYGYAAGVPGAMGWNQFGGAAWNPYSTMGYGANPMWPSQFAHMWPLHPYYQTVVPAQEGMCSYDRPFKCWGSSTCITIEAVCDKTFDCNNHADEDPRICIVGRRPSYDTLVSYLALPDQKWMLEKLFNNVDPYTAAQALKLATSLGDLRWSLALTDENINNTKTVLEAVKNDDKEPLEALGMQASAWEAVKFLMNNLLSTDFFLD